MGEKIELMVLLLLFRCRYPELSKGMEKAHSHNYKCDSIPGYSDWIEGWASRCKHVASALPHVDLQQTRDYLTSFKTFNMQSKCPIMNENDFEICNVLCAYAVSAESILGKPHSCRFSVF